MSHGESTPRLKQRLISSLKLLVFVSTIGFVCTCADWRDRLCKHDICRSSMKKKLASPTMHAKTGTWPRPWDKGLFSHKDARILHLATAGLEQYVIWWKKAITLCVCVCVCRQYVSFAAWNIAQSFQNKHVCAAHSKTESAISHSLFILSVPNFIVYSECFKITSFTLIPTRSISKSRSHCAVCIFRLLECLFRMFFQNCTNLKRTELIMHGRTKEQARVSTTLLHISSKITQFIKQPRCHFLESPPCTRHSMWSSWTWTAMADLDLYTQAH